MRANSPRSAPMVWSRRRSSSSWVAIVVSSCFDRCVQGVGIGLLDLMAKRGEIGPRGGDHELLLAGGAGRFQPDEVL